MYSHILFDLDGTITDSGLGIKNAILYALGEMNIPVQDNLDYFIGPPLLESFQKYYGMEIEEAKRAVYLYRIYYHKQGMYENEVYEGMAEVLAKLSKQGYQLVLATSKPEWVAKEVLKHFHLDEYFSLIVGHIDGVRSSKLSVMSEVLRRISVDGKNCLMIGDHSYDGESAKALGMDFIACLYGYGEEAALRKLTKSVINEPIQLLQIL